MLLIIWRKNLLSTLIKSKDMIFHEKTIHRILLDLFRK